MPLKFKVQHNSDRGGSYNAIAGPGRPDLVYCLYKSLELLNVRENPRPLFKGGEGGAPAVAER